MDRKRAEMKEGGREGEVKGVRRERGRETEIRRNFLPSQFNYERS